MHIRTSSTVIDNTGHDSDLPAMKMCEVDYEMIWDLVTWKPA